MNPSSVLARGTEPTCQSMVLLQDKPSWVRGANLAGSGLSAMVSYDMTHTVSAGLSATMTCRMTDTTPTKQKNNLYPVVHKVKLLS